jgi:hypothetical protein
MALKISGITVVNDSRELTNIIGASGNYDGFHPTVTTITTTLDFDKPVMIRTLTSASSFTTSNVSAGQTSILILDTSATGYDPSFTSAIKWPDDNEPTWADHRYWVISFICVSGTSVRANAAGYNS